LKMAESNPGVIINDSGLLVLLKVDDKLIIWPDFSFSMYLKILEMLNVCCLSNWLAGALLLIIADVVLVGS